MQRARRLSHALCRPRSAPLCRTYAADLAEKVATLRAENARLAAERQRYFDASENFKTGIASVCLVAVLFAGPVAVSAFGRR